MAETAEVVIVGGGIVGCATAYFLARQGVKATIIERGDVAGCASGYAAGLLNPLNGHGIPGPIEPLANESFGMHLYLADELKSETGIDSHLRPISCMWMVFKEADAEGFMELYQLASRLDGFPARWLDAQEVKSLEPRVSPHVLKAMCVEGVRQVSAYEYTLALSEAAKKYGATIKQGTVQGLKRSNGRVSAVVLEGEEIACEKVLLAMGPWSGQVESWLGIPVPVGPLKGQILRLELDGPPLEHALYRSGGGYVSSKPDGLVWVGTTEETVGFDDRPTVEARESIMRDSLEIMPALSQARLSLQTACLRPVSEDGLPILGEVPGWEGVFLATGAGRKGILLGPAMAQATADLLIAGRTDLPVGDFSPGRFIPGP